MGGLAIFNAYAMRSAMSVAITEMAEAASSGKATPADDSCQAPADGSGNTANSTGWLPSEVRPGAGQAGPSLHARREHFT